MTEFKTEAEVETLIADRLTDAGSKARVSVFSDEQGADTVVRSVVFKAAVALDGSESIVNAMADIGTQTDRAVSYVGSKVDPTNEGEIRYLFFQAKINPYEEQSWE